MPLSALIHDPHRFTGTSGNGSSGQKIELVNMESKQVINLGINLFS
jgi:hypothetical protein